MQVREAVEEFLRAKYSLRHKTKRWYAQKLRVFSDWCEREGLELEQVKATAVRTFLAGVETDSSYTMHGWVQVIKSFLRWCSLEEEFESLVTEKTVRRIELPRVRQSTITIFTPEEIKRLYEVCEKEGDPGLCARDKAILSLLLDCGLRLSELGYDGTRPDEITGLRMGYVFLKPSDSYVVVTGKGGHEREVPVGNQARQVLKRYITHHRGNSASPFVFLSRRGDPLSVRSLEEVVYRLAEWAEVKDAHPHKFRHTFACMYILSGGEIFKLSRIMGHSRVEVTQRYLRAVQDMQLRKNSLSVLDTLKLGI